nr:putative reverse transcriptase domain-containing protein [Tanacetum cinerariifolium]
MMRDLDQQMEKRADDGKENMVTDALSRKELMKPRRVRAMAMPFTMGMATWFGSTDGKERRREFVSYGSYLVPLVGSEMDEAHASGYLTLEDMVRAYVIDFGGSYRSSIRCAPFEALYRRKCRKSPKQQEIIKRAMLVIGNKHFHQQHDPEIVVLVFHILKIAKACDFIVWSCELNVLIVECILETIEARAIKKGRVKLRRVRAMSMTIQSSVKDEILATPSETSKVENAPAEMMRKANMVTDVLSRKERMKPRCVRVMAMTIHYGVRGMILVAQSKALKQENLLTKRLHGLDQQMERKEDESLYFMGSYLVPLVGSEMDEAHASSKEWNSGDDQLRLRWMIYLMVLTDVTESVKDAIGFEYCLASSSGWTECTYDSDFGRYEMGESSLTGLELLQETTDK